MMGRGSGRRLARNYGPGEEPETLPPDVRRATFVRALDFFRPYRLQVAVVVGAIVITSLLGLVNPILLKLLTDEVIIGRDYDNLGLYVGLMIVIPIVSGLIGVGQSYLNNVIGQSVVQDLRNALYAHLQRLPLRFFTETKTGEIQSRLSNDVGGVQRVVTDTATSIASNVAVVVSTVVAMVIIDWRLTILSLAMAPVFLFLTQRVGRVRREVSTETQKALADMTAVTEETLSVSGVLLAKTFGQQEAAVSRFRGLNHGLARLQIRQAMVGRWFFMLIGTVFSIIPAFVYWLAAVLAMNGDPSAPTAGDIVAFTTLQSRLFFPLGQLLSIQVELNGALALFDRIFEYLDLDPEIVDAPDAVSLTPAAVRGEVRFRRASFRYPKAPVPATRAHQALANADSGQAVGSSADRPSAGTSGAGGLTAGPHPPAFDEATADAVVEPIAEEAIEAGLAEMHEADTGAMAGAGDVEPDGVPSEGEPPDASPTGAGSPSAVPAPAPRPAPAPFALEDIDFTAEPGQLVALVGPSGSGKTTTTYLVPRLYDVDAGAVEIDGRDVRRIALASLGRVIGMVTQETYLFHASIRDNLRYAQPDATDADLETAARAAAIHDRVLELPEGYDTIVGERGYKLSGGEKQRIAIARVLLKDPRILILDEATSALDTVSERLIQAALERLMEGRTTIAIAHRLSTILRADQILVYRRGRIVERGRHEELLAAGGLYARLYHEQFEAPVAGTGPAPAPGALGTPA